ncbi:hypothetical protein [Candidatus Nitrosotalea sp. TS]|nr:hypothetical protein [Candidatus Nitrosotalea sp. TS]
MATNAGTLHLKIFPRRGPACLASGLSLQDVSFGGSIKMAS